MSLTTEALFKLAFAWDEELLYDTRVPRRYLSIMKEVIFHADLRLHEYPFEDNALFVVRLKAWIDNVPTIRQKQALCLMLPWIIFLDNIQMKALYRDAFRRIVVPFLTQTTFSLADRLAPSYDQRVFETLRKYLLFSVTESFHFQTFLTTNGLPNLMRPLALGENPEQAKHRVPDSLAGRIGALVFEDFVGTGDQALKVLSAIRPLLPADWRVLFVPLIILERGLDYLAAPLTELKIEIHPVLKVSTDLCILKDERTGEPPDFRRIRALVRATKKRVLQQLSPADVSPRNPFGYRGSGALLVTTHNTPNNSIPILHHKAPRWEPLFRRMSHASQDGLS